MGACSCCVNPPGHTGCRSWYLYTMSTLVQCASPSPIPAIESSRKVSESSQPNNVPLHLLLSRSVPPKIFSPHIFPTAFATSLGSLMNVMYLTPERLLRQDPTQTLRSMCTRSEYGGQLKLSVDLRFSMLVDEVTQLCGKAQERRFVCIAAA